MGELGNPRHEKFAKLTATGSKRADAYLGAGYHTKTREVATKRGVRLYARPDVKARVTEIETQLRENALAQAELDRAWVLRGLKENIEKSSQVKPVLDRRGNPTGLYKYEPSSVNKAYELVGKELGMFADRFIVQDLDAELEGKTPAELRAFVKGMCSEVGLRCIEMNDDELRQFILRNSERVGLQVTQLH